MLTLLNGHGIGGPNKLWLLHGLWALALLKDTIGSLSCLERTDKVLMAVCTDAVYANPTY